MDRVWMALVAAAVLLGLGAAREARAEGAEEKARALVRQLGDDDWSRREEAQRLLGEMGDEAEAPLLEALASLDAEVHARATAALAQFVRNRVGRIEIVPTCSLRVTGGAVLSLAFSPDGRLLASGGVHGDVCLWDVKARRLASALVGKDGGVDALAFEPNGNHLVSAGNGGMMWDVAKRCQVLPHWLGASSCVAWSPDGRWVAFPQEGRLYLVDPSSADSWRDTSAPENADSFFFSPDSKRLVVTCRTPARVHVFDVAKCERVDTQTFGDPVNTVRAVYRCDGALIVALDYGAVRMPGVEVTYPRRVASLAVSADGNRVAVSGDGGEICVWDREGRLVEDIDGHDEVVSALAFSPDGSLLASAGNDGNVRLWEHGKDVRLRGHAAHPASVAFTRDSSMLVTDGSDAVALDLASGERKALPLRGRLVSGAAGAQVYAVGRDTIDLWDARSEKRVASLRFPGGCRDLSIAPSADGSLLGVSTWYPHLLPDTGGVSLPMTLEMLPGGATAMAWSPDKTKVALCGGPLGREVLSREGKRLMSRVGQFTSADFDPEGKHLVYAGASYLDLIDAQTCRGVKGVAGFASWWRFLSTSAGLSYDGKKLTLWYAPTLDCQRDIDLPGAQEVSLSPDRQWLAARMANEVKVFRVKLPASLRK